MVISLDELNSLVTLLLRTNLVWQILHTQTHARTLTQNGCNKAVVVVVGAGSCWGFASVSS